MLIAEKQKLQTFKDLIAWQKSYELCLKIYKLTEYLPKSEQFGLISQLKRGSSSIPSNIAEGYNRRTKQDYLRFLYMAYGSLAELETQLLLCKDLNYIRYEPFKEVKGAQEEVQRIMLGLIRSLRH